MHTTTVVFDLDGTLIDTAPDLVAAANRSLAELGLPPVSAATIKPFVGYGARRMIVEGLRASSVELDDGEVDRLLEIYLEHYAENIAVESRPFPNVIGEIEAMRKAGARIAICTNKREDMSRRLITALGLDRHFDAIVGRDTLPVCKPHPDHLLETIARAGGDRNRAIMIGDTETDIATARAAKVPVIAVTFGYSPVAVGSYAPDVTLDNYSGLSRLAAELLGVS
ncbi:MAG: hypothetical protein RLZ98_546 [Pseudomonadota bacterium]|jgi:phosphoglycolate phosphatase